MMVADNHNRQSCTPFPLDFGRLESAEAEIRVHDSIEPTLDNFQQNPHPITFEAEKQWIAPSNRPRRLQKRIGPKQQRSDDLPPTLKRQSTEFCKPCIPWIRYTPFTMEGKPGKTCLAYDKNRPGDVVAIKQYRVGGINKSQHLLRTSHQNLVNLLDSFKDGRTIYLAYEHMSISLEQLHSGFQLQELHISFICKEVLPISLVLY